jgi:hypothetical protein
VTDRVNQTQFVVFTGPSHSGKSAAASILVSALRQRSRSAMHCSFELPMRQYLFSLIGRKYEMDEPLPELLSKTPRDFLRLEAAHLRFNYGPSALGKMLLARVSRWMMAPMYVVVDDGVSVLDCRALGNYVLVQIVRDKVDRVYPFVMPNAKMHIQNDGTLDDLKSKVASLMEELK